MTKDTPRYTQRRLSNISESLRKLSLSELLPQANSKDNYTNYEYECLKRCLETCVRISTSIDQHRRMGGHAVTSLTEYQDKLATTTSELNEFLRTMDERNIATHRPAQMCHEATFEPRQGNQEQVNTQPGRKNVSQVNSLEDICVAEDGQQTIISTKGGLIFANRVIAGTRAVQCVGQMSDLSVQEISASHNGWTSHGRGTHQAQSGTFSLT